MSLNTRTHEATGADSSKQDRLAGLYEVYYDKLARYAMAHIHRRADAEDIAAEVFVRALAALDRYEERGMPMHAWLFAIARNLIVDCQRNAGKLRQVPLEGVEVESGHNPVTETETRMEIERVGVAMKQLTRDQQEVVRLRFLGGLTSAEVGQVLHRKDGAVREMQRAALQKLRQVLDTDA